MYKEWVKAVGDDMEGKSKGSANFKSSVLQFK